MSKLMKNLLKSKADNSKKIQERFEGESLLYMGDPALQWCVGGWVRGKANLIYGPTRSAKSTIALIAAGAEQKKTGGWIVVFDSEYAHQDPNETDPETDELTVDAVAARVRYEMAGIDWTKLLIIASNEVNTLFGPIGEIEDNLIKRELNISAILVDSWAGIQGETAKDKVAEGKVAEAGNSFGGNAKVMGPVLQTLLRISAEHGVTSFFIQHCIQNMSQYGSRWVLLGGEKLKYLVHSILFVEGIQAKDAGLAEGDSAMGDKDDRARVGKKIRGKCEKSRRVVEGRSCEFYMNFKEIRFAKPEESLFELACNLGLIGHPKVPVMEDDGTQKIDKKTKELVFKENNAYWIFPVAAVSPLKFHGRDKTIEEIKNNKELYKQIFDACAMTDKLSALSEGEEMSEVKST